MPSPPTSTPSGRPPSATSPPDPKVFGPYRLIERIGAGGMADVYRAVVGGSAFERTVALKCMRAHAASAPDMARLFRDEARLSARLRHPNLVQVFDSGVVDGRCYLAMELLEGHNLAEVQRALRAAGERLAPALSVFIAREVARALAYAHSLRDERGRPLRLVHRDVSPVNVMLLRAGAVKLVDFGIARADDEHRLSVTRGRVVKGKCRYVSPEQIRNRPVDGRSDVFALGVVLWEMLTNRRLFQGASEFDTMTAVLHARITPPSEVVPGLPAGLDAITRTALARDPEQRYASAEAMADDLDEALAGLGLRHRDLPGLLERLFGAGEAAGVVAAGSPALSPARDEAATPNMRSLAIEEMTTGRLVSARLREMWLPDPAVLPAALASEARGWTAPRRPPGEDPRRSEPLGPQDPTAVGPDPTLLIAATAGNDDPTAVGSDPTAFLTAPVPGSASSAPPPPAADDLTLVAPDPTAAQTSFVTGGPLPAPAAWTVPPALTPPVPEVQPMALFGASVRGYRRWTYGAWGAAAGGALAVCWLVLAPGVDRSAPGGADLSTTAPLLASLSGAPSCQARCGSNASGSGAPADSVVSCAAVAQEDPGVQGAPPAVGERADLEPAAPPLATTVAQAGAKQPEQEMGVASGRVQLAGSKGGRRKRTQRMALAAPSAPFSAEPPRDEAAMTPAAPTDPVAAPEAGFKATNVNPFLE